MNVAVLGRRKVLFASIAVLLLAGGVWGVAAMTGGTKSTLPKDLQQAIKANANDPGKLMEKVHTAMANGNLTEQQRHELFQSVHGAMEQQMDKRMDEYYAAAPADRNAILDRQIDEMQARMKEWQKNRPAGAQDPRDPNRHGPGGGRPHGPEQPAAGGVAATTGGTASASGGGGGSGPGGGGFRGDRHGPPSRQERKAHFESRNPDERARRMAYFSAMQARAQQRGIEMPMGPRGGGGGR